MQLLLSCLNFLRGQYLDAMVAWVAKPEKGGRGGKPPKGASAAAAAAGEGGALTLDDIAQWTKVGSGRLRDGLCHGACGSVHASRAGEIVQQFVAVQQAQSQALVATVTSAKVQPPERLRSCIGLQSTVYSLQSWIPLALLTKTCTCSGTYLMACVCRCTGWIWTI